MRIGISYFYFKYLLQGVVMVITFVLAILENVTIVTFMFIATNLWAFEKLFRKKKNSELRFKFVQVFCGIWCEMSENW
jgi:hypothetical protein